MIRVGDNLGRFHLDRELGRGSNGVVYEATDTLLNDRVAVKLLHPWLSGNPEMRERFKRELVLTRRVNHDGICRLHDLHEDGDTVFITMQYIEGVTLSVLVRDEGVLSPSRSIPILRRLCTALAAAHKAGVIHRDLKPGNIAVRDDDHVTILDFGIATATDVGRLTRPGQTVGSLRFIPPEVWEGNPATALGDIYAIGVIAYAVLAGRLPYDPPAGASMLDVLTTTVPPPLVRFNPDVTPELEAVIRKAMAIDPTARYARVDELERALAALPVDDTGSWTSSTGSGTGKSFSRVKSSSSAPEHTGTVVDPPRAHVRLTPEPSMRDTTVFRFNAGDSDLSGDELSALPESEPEGASADDDVSDERTRETRAFRLTQGSADTLAQEEAVSSDDLVETVAKATPMTVAPEALQTVREHVVAVEPSVPSSKAAPSARTAMIAVAGVATLAGIVAVAVALASSGEPPPRVVEHPRPPVPLVPESPPPALAPSVVPRDDATDPSGAVDEHGSNDVIAPDVIAPEGDAEPQLQPARPRTSYSAELRQTQAVLRRKGIVEGDVAQLDAQLASARGLNARGRASDATAALEKARAMAAEAKVDRAWVLAKLKRFNQRYDATEDALARERLKPIAQEISVRYTQGDFGGANERLNRAFAILDRR